MEFLYQSLFKSWKTSLTGILGAVVWFASQYGIVISKEVSDAVIVVTLFVVALLSKDGTATHTKE